jgi:threonine synthase
VTDDGFRHIVERLDDGICTISGQRFRITPFGRQPGLGAALRFSHRGGIWVKDETGNVSGSHKGRHLAGIMLYLLRKAPDTRPDLAIASCGNAALAAAVVARAAAWPLSTFVPPDANPVVLDQLRKLGATIVVCPRRSGELGDPCYHRFREALATGALPFCCQGPDNGLTIEGGETIAYEIVDQVGGNSLDAIVVQVGGGALASACVQGLERGVAMGALATMPRLYTVQTEGAAPLARAFERVVARTQDYGNAGALGYAATHRPEFMWPWEQEPHSVAHGILDDETYDWLAVARAMLASGGRPLVVDEATLLEAARLARDTTGIDADETGTSGLAGLLALAREGELDPGESIAVLFTGARRLPSAHAPSPQATDADGRHAERSSAR